MQIIQLFNYEVDLIFDKETMLLKTSHPEYNQITQQDVSTSVLFLTFFSHNYIVADRMA